MASYYNCDMRSALPAFQKPVLDFKSYKPSALAEFHALNNPNYPFAILTGFEDAYTSAEDVITWNEIGSAMVKLAAQILKTTTTPGPDPTVIGLICSNDPLVYYIMILTILRLGSIPLLISPRNAPVAISHLIQTSGCTHVYVEFPLETSERSKITISEKLNREKMDDVKKLLPEGYSLTLHRFPSAFDLFPRLSTKGAPYTFNHDLPQQMSKIPMPNPSDFTPVLFSHSSGTTGIPKLIALNRITFRAFLMVTDYGNFSWTGELTSALVLPPFHALGLFIGLYLPLAQGAISGFFRPELDIEARCVIKTPNALTIVQAMKSLACTIAVLSPLTLAEYSQDRDSVKFLKGLKRVAFGGAPLSVEVGNSLHQQGVRLATIYGLTEVGIASVCFPEPCLGADWEYFELWPEIKTLLNPQENGLYELVILSSDTYRTSITFEKEFGPQIYHTSDLIAKHPTRPLYRIVGRLDDQIVLSNSEKINPVPLETILAGDLAINGALLFGNGKPMVGVIIEPSHPVDINDCSAVEAFLDLIWPSIQAANQSAPSHSRLTRSLILVTDPRSKPLPKTSKGAVARSKTLELLAEEIEKMYSGDLAFGTASQLPLFDHVGNFSENSVYLSTKNLVENVLGKQVKEDEDLFLQGCDSVHVYSIRSKLGQLFKIATKKTLEIPANVVYKHSTVATLAKWTSNILFEKTYAVEDKRDPCEPLHLMIKKYLPCTV